MVGYKEAKEIALKFLEGTGCKINYAGELPTGYVFENEDEFYDAYVPLVVEKDTGKICPYYAFMDMHKYKAKQIKDIPF